MRYHKFQSAIETSSTTTFPTLVYQDWRRRLTTDWNRRAVECRWRRGWWLTNRAPSSLQQHRSHSGASSGSGTLTAIGIDQVIGSAAFLLPSQVAAQVGNWSPVAFLSVGFASLLVALCFAEVGSRFEGTGGPYLYTRAAFGRFAAFDAGWMQWFTRVTSQASIANAIALALGFSWPVTTSGAGRTSVIAAVTLAIGWINLRGIRQSAVVINLLTRGPWSLALLLFMANDRWLRPIFLTRDLPSLQSDGPAFRLTF